MADFGRSFIDILGNSSVTALTHEVNKRLDSSEPSTAIGEVFYGLPNSAAAFDYRVTGSDWVSPAQGEFGDVNQICLTSSTDIPEKLENHLVWFYSKVDPDVVLRNTYDSDRGDFVGVRFKLVRGGKIFTFHKHRSINGNVVFESERDEADDEEITWDELWEIQRDLEWQAFAELVEQFPFAKKYAGVR
jgi:hypothetical protein